jgi:glyoxylase-like metal-dependent hydrolase (beta-lactamase superfamily II)
MLERDIAPGIHRVEDAHTNWYLVEEGNRLTVVDTGHPGSWRSLGKALAELGHGHSDIDAVVLTHAHFDHMGFAHRTRELGIPLWAHEDETSVVRHPWRYDHERSRVPYLRHPTFVKVLTEMTVMGALWVKGTTPTETFTDGDLLDVPGRPRVIFTPGHTHGHCALLFVDRGALLVGDAFVTLDPYSGRGGPCVVSGAATASSSQALGSLERLVDLDVGVVGTGHGPVWRGSTSKAVERAREAGPA